MSYELLSAVSFPKRASWISDGGSSFNAAATAPKQSWLIVKASVCNHKKLIKIYLSCFEGFYNTKTASGQLPTAQNVDDFDIGLERFKFLLVESRTMSNSKLFSFQFCCFRYTLDEMNLSGEISCTFSS